MMSWYDPQYTTITLAVTPTTVSNTTSANITDYNDTTLEPPDQQHHNEEFCQAFRFYVNIVAVSVLSVFGIIGNTLSAILLNRERCHKITRFLLQALAIADNLLLFMSFTILVISHAIKNPNSAFRHIAYKYLHPIAFMPLVCTIWFTVLIAVNRYVVICRPLRANTLCSLRRTKIQVLVISIMSVLLNVPRFFQFELVYENGRIVGSKHTSIGTKTTFGIVYNNFVYNIVVLIIPLVILIPLSFSIVFELRRMQERRSAMALLVAQTTPVNDEQSQLCNRKLSSIIPCIKKDNKGKDELNLTYVTIIIIVVLIVCHTPDRILQVLKLSKARITGCSSGMLYYFALLCNVFVILNSSTNFVTYYFLRRRFRYRLWAMLRCKQVPDYMENGNWTPNYTETGARSCTGSNQSLHRIHKLAVNGNQSNCRSDVNVNNVIDRVKQTYTMERRYTQ